MFVKKWVFVGMNVVSMSPVHMCCGSGRRFGHERYEYERSKTEPRDYHYEPFECECYQYEPCENAS